MGTIGEYLGVVDTGPQYNHVEALALVREYFERITLEGQLIDLDIQRFGEDKVQSYMGAHQWFGGDAYKQMDLDTLKDSVDYALMREG